MTVQVAVHGKENKDLGVMILLHEKQTDDHGSPNHRFVKKMEIEA